MSFCLSSNLNPNPSTSLSSAFTARPLTTTGWLGWKGEGGEGRREGKEGGKREGGGGGGGGGKGEKEGKRGWRGGGWEEVEIQKTGG